MPTKEQLESHNTYVQVSSKLAKFMMDMEKQNDITITQWIRIFSQSIIFLAKNLEELE